ncbi:MAG: hypothetical protein WCD86_17485 [Ktedonobacteraceae bacterium]
MIPQAAQQAMKEWLKQATPPEQQLDRRWIERCRELNAQDSFWWLSWAGPFTPEEQAQWDILFNPPIDEATKAQLAPIVAQSRERELEAALAEQREPRLHYPAIEIDEVRRRIAGLTELDAEIEREEPYPIVRQLYHERLQEDIDYDRLIEATYEGERERFWACSQRVFHKPMPEEMASAFSWVRRLLQQGFQQPETAEISHQLLKMIQDRLHFSLDLSSGADEPPVAIERDPDEQYRMISAEGAKRFYEAVLYEGGYEEWRVSLDAASGGIPRVEPALRQVILPDDPRAIDIVKTDLAHELAGHLARSFAGEHSPLGLLGIGTRDYPVTEEGLALYYERQMQQVFGYPRDDSGLICSMLALGLASGVVTPAQTFFSVYAFIERLVFLYRRLLRPWNAVENDQRRAHAYALYRALRTFRGVPDLEQAGVCYLQDAMYLRGLLLMERLAAEDETILDRLMIGKVAYERLSMVESLHLVSSPQPLRDLAFDPALDDYILSFEATSEDVAKPA